MAPASGSRLYKQCGKGGADPQYPALVIDRMLTHSWPLDVCYRAVFCVSYNIDSLKIGQRTAVANVPQ